MVAMDTKFRRIYRAISDVRMFSIFNSNSLKLLSMAMKRMAWLSQFFNSAPKRFYGFLKFTHMIFTFYTKKLVQKFGAHSTYPH